VAATMTCIGVIPASPMSSIILVRRPGPVAVGAEGDAHARGVALLRHAYILPEHQHHGIGLRLVEHLESEARRDGVARGLRRIIVGTYARNYKARGALEKAGYRLSADSATILREYYSIPEDQLRASVTYEKPA
jgi:GNAT superfamily N-acetyltransferase